MEKLSAKSHRIGFYPCCCDDIEEPRHLLAEYVDEILFCDKKRSSVWDHISDVPGLPRATFIQGDVLELIQRLPPLTVLFYRKDSSGEGGSKLHIVGKEILPQIMRRFGPEGGWIFSDGSNSTIGYSKFSRSFRNLLRQEWQSKPSFGFKVRLVEDLTIRLARCNPIYVIEARPLK